MPRSSRHRSHRGHRHERDRSGSPSSDEDEVQKSGSRRRRADGSPPELLPQPQPLPPPPPEDVESKKRKAASPSTRAGLEGGANAAAGPAAADPGSDHGGRKRKDRDSKAAVEPDAAPVAPAADSDRWNGDAGADGLVEDKRMKVDGSPASSGMEKAAPPAVAVAKGKVSAADSRTRAGGTSSSKRHGAGADGGGGKDESGTATKDESSRRRADKELSSSARREAAAAATTTTTTDRDREQRAPDKDYGHAHGHGSSRNGERGSDKDRGHHGRDKQVEPEGYSKDDKSKKSSKEQRPANADGEAHPDRDSGRKTQDDLYSSDTERRLKKQTARDGSSDKGRSKGDGRDNEDRVNDLDRNGAYRDTEKHRRYRDRSREDADRDRRSRDDRHRVGADRPSRDHSNERSENRYQKDMNKRPENHRRQDKDRESTPSTRDHGMKYVDGRVRKRPLSEKEEPTNAKSRDDIEARAAAERNISDMDYISEDRGRPESVHSNRVDSNSRNKQPRRSPNSAVHVLQDDCRALSKDRNHTSSASSGDRASISGAAEKALDSFSVESNAKVKGTPQSADYVIEDGLPSRSDGHLSAIQVPERSPRVDRYNTDRKGNISSGSPRNIPPSSMRHVPGSPVVQGSAEYDGRAHSGDYRNAGRYKRNGDSKMARGQGNWNGVPPNWAPPVPNGYMHFPHGPPGPFHQVGQQYPAPSIFGVRPLMDFNHAGVPFRMHEAPPDRFHGRPFGWRNPSGDSGPQFQGWEGNGGMFGNEPHMFGREWEHGRQLNNQGWETSGGMKGQDEKTAMSMDSTKRPDLSAPQVQKDEILTGELENKTKRCLPDMGQKVKPVVQQDSQTDSKSKAEPAAKPSNIDNNSPGFLGLLLSKLDVSLNLASPELHMRINMKNQNGDGKISDGMALKQINGRAGEKLNVGTWSLSHSARPFLPAVADDIFKKAVSLYNVNGEGRGSGLKLPQVENGNNGLSTSSGENKTSIEKDSRTSVADAVQLPESSVQAMDVDNADVKEQELANTPDVSNANHSSVQLSGNYLGTQAPGSDLVDKFAKECVGLIPEFVTRIHSPGSSH